MQNISAKTLENITLVYEDKWYEVSAYDCGRLVADGFVRFTPVKGYMLTFEGRKALDLA